MRGIWLCCMLVGQPMLDMKGSNVDGTGNPGRMSQISRQKMHSIIDATNHYYTVFSVVKGTVNLPSALSIY